MTKQLRPYDSVVCSPDKVDDVCNNMFSQGYELVSICSHPDSTGNLICMFRLKSEEETHVVGPMDMSHCDGRR